MSRASELAPRIKVLSPVYAPEFSPLVPYSRKRKPTPKDWPLTVTYRHTRTHTCTTAHMHTCTPTHTHMSTSTYTHTKTLTYLARRLNLADIYKKQQDSECYSRFVTKTRLPALWWACVWSARLPHGHIYSYLLMLPLITDLKLQLCFNTWFVAAFHLTSAKQIIKPCETKNFCFQEKEIKQNM